MEKLKLNGKKGKLTRELKICQTTVSGRKKLAAAVAAAAAAAAAAAVTAAPAAAAAAVTADRMNVSQEAKNQKPIKKPVPYGFIFPGLFLRQLEIKYYLLWFTRLEASCEMIARVVHCVLNL